MKRELITQSTCRWCGEELADHERDEDRSLHNECAARIVIGSLAHVEERCSCYMPGSTENDPPNMTKREAAIAALKAYKLKQMRTDGQAH